MVSNDGKTAGRLRRVARHWRLAAAVLIGLVLGYAARFLLSPVVVEQPPGAATTQAAAGKQQQWWTCSMHPQIRLPKPGLCPICKMELIPLEQGLRQAGPPRLTLTAEAAKLLQIETAAVERKFVTADIRMVGKVAYDETRLKYITAWVAGRLDRLFVDYTGVPVRQGDHMVYLYSPELLSAQEELLQALKAVKDTSGGDIGIVRQTARATLDAAREKLRLWGLTAQQIAEIEASNQPSDHVTIYAPIGGIVVHKNAQQGMYVDVGTQIYTIADLSHVWVILDAYESDLMWLRYGQKVQFTTVSYPGETFTGVISFIDPVLNEMTRTVNVRVDVPNADGRLKPEMFVKAVVRAEVAAGGRVMAPDLAGKWICPMHPSVIKDAAGNCDICGMPLVRTESLGYVAAAPTAADEPLVIPVSAALVTGARAVVYVQTGEGDKLTFEGRQVALGPRAGDYYLVAGGLGEGDRVVTRGNFKIDSALQIQAKPSMMSIRGGTVEMQYPATQPATAAAVSGEFVSQLQKVLDGYLAIQAALAADSLGQAAAAAKAAEQLLAGVDMKLLSGEDHERWMASATDLHKALAEVGGAADIQAARKAFAVLSEQMAASAGRYGLPASGAIYRMHCPMAFEGRGADWLQVGSAVHNPYFGSAMPQCGDVVEVMRHEGLEPAPAGEHRHE